MVNALRGDTMITLLHPWLLLLLPLPFLVYFALPEFKQKALAYRIPFFELAAKASEAHVASGSQVHAKPKVDLVFATLIWFCCVIAIAHPIKLGAVKHQDVITRDIMLAIDLSGSMAEQDFESSNGDIINRLDAVSNVVSEFINARENDRIGLIVFGTRAYLQVPFTQDLKMAERVLRDASVAMAGPHTAIGDAIGLALKLFEESQVTEKTLILLTDGADTGSRMSPLNAAHIAKSDGLKIFTIGIGNENGEGQYKVDFDTLAEIANITDGEFYRATNQDTLQNVYQEIDKIAAVKSKQPQARKQTSIVHIPLAIALLVYLIALLKSVITIRKAHV